LQTGVSSTSPNREGIDGTRVLVAESNATTRRILVNLLEEWKATAVAVDSGAAARSAKSNSRTRPGAPFQLILLDDRLRAMQSYDFAKLVRDLPGCGDGRIVLLGSAFPID